MTPLEKIKVGILRNDMKLIESAYTDLTGEIIIVIDVSQVEAKPIPDMEPMPYELEEETTEDPDDPFRVQIRGENKQQTRELEDGTIQTEARKESVDLSKIAAFNMFSDDGSEDIENRKGDKGLYVKKPEPRRQEVKKVTASCVDCQKIFKVLPIHQMEGSFTCTKCIKRKQRR